MNQRRGSVLILTLSLMTAAVVLVLAYFSMITHDIALINSQSSAVHALYVAEAGINKAVWYLLNTAPDATTSGEWRTSAYPTVAGPDPSDPQEESFEGGTYTMWVEDSGANILVTSSGIYHGVTRTVHQQVQIDYTPHALRYPVFSGGDMDFGNTAGTISGSTASRGSSVIPFELAVSGTVYENTTVNAPMVDVAAYEAMADTVISGNQNFSSGVYTGIWYVDGDVTIGSNVDLTGSIVATGNIDFAGQSNITITASMPNPALLSASDIFADNSSGINFAGLVYAADEIEMNDVDNFSLNGALIVGTRITSQNSTNLSLLYDSQIFSSPPPYFSDGTNSKTLTAVAGSWGMI